MADGLVARSVRAVLAGYSATWILMRQVGRHPFGEASAAHRTWLLPQFVVALGSAPLVGAVQGYWTWPAALAFGTPIVGVGLALVAWVGRQLKRGRFGDK